MASPRWKNGQHRGKQENTRNVYERSQSYEYEGTTPQSPIHLSQPVREVGIIEKLLHSYGFIQCCQRQDRVFFHYSQYRGDINQVCIGDAVEFIMGADRKTNKPIACDVITVPPVIASPLPMLHAERVLGTVISQARFGCEGSQYGDAERSMDGGIQYEQSGESFFLPYNTDDLTDPSQNLQVGDQVTFLIAPSNTDGSLRAVDVEALNHGGEKIQGVICTLKDSFGFIERADVVKEVFFHFTEYQGDLSEMHLGEDVEFCIQDRHNKEVAVSIVPLPSGTVIFEDVSEEKLKGYVKKTVIRNRRQLQNNDTAAGRISFKVENDDLEIQFSEKDISRDYTLLEGDFVSFHIATDRRDEMQHATLIELQEESFLNSDETRETGVIAVVKEGFGFIKCAEREARMFFHFSELLNFSREPKPQDEVEFTVTEDCNSNRPVAIRIRTLPKGSVTFEKLLEQKYVGHVEKEAFSKRSSNRSPTKSKEGTNNTGEIGAIVCSIDNETHTVQFFMKDVDVRNVPKIGDTVEFQLLEQTRNGTKTAVNIRVLTRASSGQQLSGFITGLKENFGFIETLEHDREIFFHYSNFDGNPNVLHLGDEVKYNMMKKNGKQCAENVIKIPLGTIPVDDLEDKVYEGTVIRQLRANIPDGEYAGLVQDSELSVYPYTIVSLLNKQELLQKGDSITFQLTKSNDRKQQFAANIVVKRQLVQSRVEAIKGQFGFMSYEAEEGKKLFFHMSEVMGSVELQVGDVVQFFVIHNQQTGKKSACNVNKISSQTDVPRPERLLSRLKSISLDESQPRIVVLRQPKPPDGANGFKFIRSVKIPVK